MIQKIFYSKSFNINLFLIVEYCPFFVLQNIENEFKKVLKVIV